MLRIHRQCLSGRDTEERGVEVRDTVDEAAGARVGLVARVGIGIEQPRQIPPTIAGKLRHHVAAVGHHLPQALRGINATREATRHADDRDRLARSLQQRTVGALQALNLDQRFAQRFGRMLELIRHQ
jgi:hypothetical protein